MSASHTISDATCTRCGCTCNDVELQVQAGKIVAAKHACPLGSDWFTQSFAEPASSCIIDGQPATVAEGISQAANILQAARYPLVYGLTESTTADQRAACAIADRLGAVIDLPNSRQRGPRGLTFRGVGEVTSTLGEVRNRSDVVLFWQADPLTTHPRHAELYSLLPRGEFLPQGRSDRFCIVIDTQPTATSAQADQFLQIQPGSTFEAIWILRALLAQTPLAAAEVEQQTGIALADWQKVVDRLRQARYGAIFYDSPLTKEPSGYVQVEALQGLTKDLNRHARTVCRALGTPGNPTGAEQVLTWSTGYPQGVNFSRSFPRYNPGEYSAEQVLVRGEADAALIIGETCVDSLSAAARQHIASIPAIVFCYQRDRSELPNPKIVFQTAIPGIHTAGTVYRIDGVALPLRPACHSALPPQAVLLTQLEEAIKRI